MPLRYTGILPAAVLAIALTGCSQMKAVNTSQDLPVHWQGRQLYNSPAAYIYASTPSMAQEADAIAQNLNDAYLEYAHQTPQKGILIISSKNDSGIIPDIRKRFEIKKEYEMQSRNRPPLTQKEMEDEWNRYQQTKWLKLVKKETQGWKIDYEVQTEICVVCLTPEELIHYSDYPGTISEEIKWAALIIPRNDIDNWIRNQVNEEVRNNNFGLIDRMQISLSTASQISHYRDMILFVQKSYLFAYCVARQAEICGWPKDRKDAIVRNYMETEAQRLIDEKSRLFPGPIHTKTRVVLDDPE